jgi:hypothetical protein
MGKTLTHEFVKNYFEKNGCVLLEQYKGCKILMEYICSCGNKSKICWSNFSSGRRCLSCGYIRTTNKHRLTYEFVKNYFEEQGCKLLENEYKDSSIKMNYMCSCGNRSSITWANFSQGYRCRVCGIKKTAKARRFSNEYVKQYFEEHNCKLIDEYKGALTPMHYICECGNEDKIRFSKFKIGQRCRKCKYRKSGAKSKLRTGAMNGRWNPDREYVQLNKLIHQKFTSMVANILKATGKKKSCRSAELLGYTRKELRDHLTNHPNWSTIQGRWSIDHIFPIKAFLEHGIIDIKLINCLDNLQPLELKANISKSGKYSKEDFLRWLNQKGIKIHI